MSTFTSPAVVELLDNYQFRLVEPFQFYLGDPEYPDALYTVPAGFETDLASVPRVLWALLPPHGRYAKAAILHDWLTTAHDAGFAGSRILPVERQKADAVFRSAMLVLGVSPWLAWLMYRAVRAWSIWLEIPDLRMRFRG